jgi:hypothetical protein
MSVQQIVQGDGQWSLSLKPGTPGAIRDLLNDEDSFFSILRIFSGHIDADMVPTMDPLFSGVLLRADGLECSGAGPNWYLGSADSTGDQFGPIFETAITFTGGTLTQWTHDVADKAGLGYGTIGATAATWSGTLQYVTPRVVINPWMVAGFDQSLEYRVDPGLTLSVGRKTELYRTPLGNDINTVIIEGQTVARTEVDLIGVSAPEMDLSNDATDLTRRVIIKGASTTSGSSVAGWNYKNPDGGTLDRIRYTVNDQVTSGDMPGALNRILEQYQDPKKDIRVSLAEQQPLDFICGDYVWVYDPVKGLVDFTASPFTYAGESIWPVAVRVMEMTWPIHAGLGVYLDATHQAGDVTDLTDYVQWEDGDISLTVGAYPRTLGFLPKPVS